jgi:chromosome partitioning protein
VIVPLQPSIFDIHATHAFVRELKSHRRNDRVKLALVGMRTKEGTLAADHLHKFLETMDVPLVAFLRDTQNYVHLAARGLTLWDVAPGRVQRDLDQWSGLTTWVDLG